MATKTAVFQIRLTEEEKRMIQEKAESLGLSMGRYLVMLAIQDKQNKQPKKNKNFQRQDRVVKILCSVFISM